VTEDMGLCAARRGRGLIGRTDVSVTETEASSELVSEPSSLVSLRRCAGRAGEGLSSLALAFSALRLAVSPLMLARSILTFIAADAVVASTSTERGRYLGRADVVTALPAAVRGRKDLPPAAFSVPDAGAAASGSATPTDVSVVRVSEVRTDAVPLWLPLSSDELATTFWLRVTRRVVGTDSTSLGAGASGAEESNAGRAAGRAAMVLARRAERSSLASFSFSLAFLATLSFSRSEPWSLWIASDRALPMLAEARVRVWRRDARVVGFEAGGGIVAALMVAYGKIYVETAGSCRAFYEDWLRAGPSTVAWTPEGERFNALRARVRRALQTRA
jgi:hypothetical protein